MQKIVFFICTLLLSNFIIVRAQINLPEPSPSANFNQVVGFTDIGISYSRPCAKGRKVFGDLVPYHQLWRTGASDATLIRFNDKIQFENTVIESGTYSLFSIPSDNEWVIVINKDTTLHGTGGYSEEKDAVRFKVKSEKSSRFYETFTIEISDIINNNATLYLIWENTQVRINLKTTADDRIMADIQKKIAQKKDDSNLLFQAAKYYYETDKDLKEPLNWIEKAVEITKDNFYYFYQKALIEAKFGNYASAIDSAKKSLALAQEKKLKDWILKNEILIDKWQKSNKK